MIPRSDEGLAHYLEMIGHHPRLTVEQEKQASREALILSNLRLAVHIAKKYARGVDQLLDCIQDANVGLVQAADAYDPTRGKFSMCAALYIRAAIRNRRTDGLGKRLGTRRGDELPAVGYIDDLPPGHEETSPDDPAEHAHRYLALRHAGRVLNDKQRETLLARLNGDTYEEIGARRGVTQQSVRQLEKAAVKIITGGGCVSGNSRP